MDKGKINYASIIRNKDFQWKKKKCTNKHSKRKAGIS